MSLKIDRVQLEIIVQQDSARQKMVELEKQMRDASRELSKLKKQFGENSEQYKAQAAVVRNLKQQYDGLFDEIGIGHLSLKELTNRQRELNVILRNLDPSLPEWKQYNQQLKEVNARIKELKGTATETGLSLSKLADGFNRYAAIGAGALATLTGMTLTMRKCVDEYAQMEEAESQVVKYTGMTREETKELNEEFKRMDTRTPREELNRLAGEAGKLGITGRQNVLEFVEAANQINVALGEDLGEEAVNQIGKLSQMFGDESRSLKDNMLAIGSAVNQVAQSTSASEPYLVEFTARMGGVGKQARMSVTDIMGFASALDQNMLRSEMASTALSGLIMRIFQEPAKYAKLAGMDVEEFTNLVKTDVNEAVITFLSALNKMGGMAQMAPVLKEMQLSGAEAASVISTLAGNVDLVRKEQENANRAFQEGTSITNEYSVQNNTVQAELDKARKGFQEVRIELGERLEPVMKNMVSLGSLSVKGFLVLIKTLDEYHGVLIGAAAGLAGYTVATKASIVADKAKVLWTGRITTGMRRLFILLKANPWGIAITAVTALVGGLMAWKHEQDDVRQSMKTMNGELTVEQGALNHLFTSLQEAGDGTERRRDLIEEINQRYGTYLPNLLTEKSSLDEIKAAYDRINTAMTQQIVLKHRNEAVNSATEEAAAKQMDILESLRQSVIGVTGDDQVASRFIKDLREMAAAATETGTDYRKSVANAMNRLESLYLGGRKLTGGMKSDIQDFMNNVYQLDKSIEYINKKYEGWMPEPDEGNGQGTVLPEVTVTAARGSTQTENDAAFKKEEERISQRLSRAKAEAKALLHQSIESGKERAAAQDEYDKALYKAEKAALFERRDLLAKNGKDTSELQAQIYDRMIAEADRLYERRKKQQQDSLDSLEAQKIAEEDVQKKAYADGEMGEREYREKLLEIERVYLEKRREMLAGFGLDTAETDRKLLDMDVEEREETRKKEKEQGLRAVFELSDPDTQLEMLKAMYDEDILSFEEYQRLKDQILAEHEDNRDKILRSASDSVQSILSSASQYMQIMQDRELNKVENKYDREIKAAQKAGKDTTELEEEKEEAMQAIRKKYADKQFALSVLQVTASTAVAAMEAYKAMAGIPLVGPALGALAAAAALATGAVQIAAAKQQQEEAKGLKSGGFSSEYVEGYTRKGNPDDTAGVIPVHKNEFVANHEAVANPAVRQFLDVFDLAQKRGTIRMLNTTQILEQVRTRGGKYEGGYSGKGAAATPAASLQPGELTADQRSQIVMLLVENNRLLAILCRKELVVDPRKIRDSLRRLERLEDNVSR